MIQEGIFVNGIDMDGKEVEGKVEHIAGFGNVAIVRIGDDRLDLTSCNISDITELKE